MSDETAAKPLSAVEIEALGYVYSGHPKLPATDDIIRLLATVNAQAYALAKAKAEIDRLTRERDEHHSTLLTWGDPETHLKRAEAAEARVKALEALRDTTEETLRDASMRLTAQAERIAKLEAAARDHVARHDAAAKRANFDGCGCADCTPFHAALASPSEPAGRKGE